MNIINSLGSIEKINIRNSYQDAIDFDFSNLMVEEINVENSGNDCIDVSAGQYYINKLNLNECKDKGISTGEKSNLTVSNATIKNTNIALVSKDDSKLIVNNAYLENNNLCVVAYNKKQEFGPSYISIPKKLCPKDKNKNTKYFDFRKKMIPRIEQKSEINKIHYLDLLKWINNTKGEILYPERIICSRYLDNKNMQMYFDTIEGIVPRKKIRIRTYGTEKFSSSNGEYCLELKMTTEHSRFKKTHKDINFKSF